MERRAAQEAGDVLTVRIGVLGAAQIVPNALTKPAREVDGAEVVAVAARDGARARAFAARHDNPRVLDSYQALVEDPDVDAVYIPLPNGLHGRWTLAALAAGKHVLCEKPFTANAEEAEEVAAAADASGLVVMEAFHWRYHPLAQRMVDIVRSGELGEIRRVETAMCFPLAKRGDIRWQADLAGGSLMDTGCYAVHWARTLLGEEPEVTGARTKLRAPGIDRYTQVDLRFPGGATGLVTSAMWSARALQLSARVEGTEGTLKVLNPIAPQYFHRMSVRTAAGSRREKVAGDATYTHQLRAFVDAVEHGTPTLTPPSESVANMRVLDAAYRAAGLEPRRPTSSRP
jgi:predicted dehydrogenase